MRFITAKSFSSPGVLTEWSCSQSSRPTPSIPPDWMLRPVDSEGRLLYGMMIFSVMRFCPHHLSDVISFFYKSKKANQNHVINDVFVYLIHQNLNEFLNLEIKNKNEKLITSFINMLYVNDYSGGSYFQSQLMMMFFNFFISTNNHIMVSRIINSSSNNNNSDFISSLMNYILGNYSHNKDNGDDVSLCINSVVKNFDFHEVLRGVFSSWFDHVRIEIKLIRGSKLKIFNHLFSFYPSQRLTNKDKEAIKFFFKDSFDYNIEENHLPHIKAFMQKSNLQEQITSSSKTKKERLI